MLEESLPHRAPWNTFPDVVVFASQSAVKKHRDYEQAKQGNVQDAAPAAKRLAVDLITDSGLQRIREWQIEGAVLVPVHALEGQGYNRIPAAFAELLAERLGLEVETGIIQVNVVNHTGARGWRVHRSLKAPCDEELRAFWSTTLSGRAAPWPTCAVTSSTVEVTL